MFALGIIFNFYFALGKNLSVPPPVTLIKECPPGVVRRPCKPNTIQANGARVDPIQMELSCTGALPCERALKTAVLKGHRN